MLSSIARGHEPQASSQSSVILSAGLGLNDLYMLVGANTVCYWLPGNEANRIFCKASPSAVLVIFCSY